MGSLEPTTSLLGQRAPSPPLSQVFQTRAASADYLRPRIPSPIGKCFCAYVSICHFPSPSPRLYPPPKTGRVFFIGTLEEFKKKRADLLCFFQGVVRTQVEDNYLAALLDK